jgi:hypothetical protein
MFGLTKRGAVDHFEIFWIPTPPSQSLVIFPPVFWLSSSYSPSKPSAKRNCWAWSATGHMWHPQNRARAFHGENEVLNHVEFGFVSHHVQARETNIILIISLFIMFYPLLSSWHFITHSLKSYSSNRFYQQMIDVSYIINWYDIWYLIYHILYIYIMT